MRRLIFVGIVALMLAGCLHRDGADMAIEAERFRNATQQAGQLAEKAEAERADLVGMLDVLPPLGDERGKVEAHIEARTADATLWRQREAALQAQLKKIEAATIGQPSTIDATGAIELGGGAVAAVLPPPWNVIATLALGLGIGLWRSHQTRVAARDALRAVEAAKQQGDGVLKFNDPKAKIVLDLAGKAGKRLVDEAQGRVISLPF